MGIALFLDGELQVANLHLASDPILALIIGVMLDQTVLRCPSEGGVTTHLKPFPKRASLILTMSGVIVASVDAWMGGMTLATAPTILCLTVIAGVIVWHWNRPFASSMKAWAGTACLAVAILMIASVQLLPTIATTRSLYVKTKFAAAKYPECRIVFFVEKPHGIKLQIDRRRVVYFPQEMRDEFVAFVANSSDLIVITADEDIDSTRTAIASTHDLKSSHAHEHLFFAKRILVNPSSPLGLPSARTGAKPMAVSIARTISEGNR